MTDRTAHMDLLAQVADSTEERDEVRRILAAALTDEEITRANGERLDAVECAVAAHKRSPWPYAPANSAHRHSQGCSRCESGLTQCVTPEACEVAALPADSGPSVMARLVDFVHTYRLYRRGGHSRRYSARIAYGCAFLGLPF